MAVRKRFDSAGGSIGAIAAAIVCSAVSPAASAESPDGFDDLLTQNIVSLSGTLPGGLGGEYDGYHEAGTGAAALVFENHTPVDQIFAYSHAGFEHVHQITIDQDDSLIRLKTQGTATSTEIDVFILRSTQANLDQICGTLSLVAADTLASANESGYFKQAFTPVAFSAGTYHVAVEARTGLLQDPCEAPPPVTYDLDLIIESLREPDGPTLHEDTACEAPAAQSGPEPLSIGVCDSDFDTALAVWSEDGTLIAEVDDGGCPETAFAGSVVSSLIGPHFVAVAGFATEFGDHLFVDTSAIDNGRGEISDGGKFTLRIGDEQVNGRIRPNGVALYRFVAVCGVPELDLTGEGRINLADAFAFVLSFADGCVNPPDDCGGADLNHDGKVDLADALFFVTNYPPGNGC